jgi:23S rRNA (uracil1939-C5)-methyltransferase
MGILMSVAVRTVADATVAVVGTEVDVTALVAGGLGLGRLPDGRVALVEAALPGDRVEIEVTEDRRDMVRARVARVVTASVDRVPEPCPHLHEGCGGCDLMHAAVGAQGPLKRSIVVDALRRIGRIDDPPVAVEVRSVPAEGYRTSLRVGVDGEGRLGLHRRRSSEVVATPGCLVAHPCVRGSLASERQEPGAEVLLRASSLGGSTLVGDAANPRGAVVEEVHGRGFRVSAGSFFQSGPAAASLLVDVVDELLGAHLPDGAHLADLYAGVGVLGACLVDRHARVRLTAVESHPAAVADLRRNLHDVPASEVVAVDVSAWVAGGPVTAAIADPARPGLGRSATAAIGRAGPEHLALVSCDPASLGRDVGLLRAQGYELGVVHVLDLFPHTSHVEAVSAWTRSST